VVKVSSDSGVKLEQASQAIATVNGAAFRRYVHRREEEKIAFALVIPFKMMMFDIRSQRRAQRSFSKENELGQAFLPHGTDPALGKRIQIRTPRRKSQWPYTTGSQDIQKRRAELRIAIVEKVPLAAEKPGTFVGGVASHLEHPLRGRMSGQAGEGDPAGFQMDEEQDVVGGETSPGKHLNGEEIGACQDGEVGGDEIAPGGSLAAFRCRRDPVPTKDVTHGLIGNSVA
jgi:hypothetical protein